MPFCVMLLCVMPLHYAFLRYGCLRYASFRDGHLQNPLVAIHLWIDSIHDLDDFLSNTDH